MARVENDSSDSDDNDDKLEEGDEHELLDCDKDDSDDESITSEEEMDVSGMEERITTLEEKILDNPYDYKSHVDLLAILVQMGVRSRVRSEYERLRDSFPLEPSQWLSWLQLEGDSVTTPEGRANIYTLFQKAFQDCFCGGIYMEWCAMSMGSEEEARKVLPEALDAAGADPLDGSLLWDTAKEFELNQLAVIGTTCLPSSDEYKEQVDRVMSIYTNQLCRPLFRAEGILEEFREFVASKKDQIVDADERIIKIEEAHVESEKILKELMEYEYQLESIVGNTEEKIHEKCAIYDKYLTYSKQLLRDVPEPNLHNLVSLINVLYDRATSDCSAALCRVLPELTKDVEDICVDYVDFAVTHCSLSESLKVIDRAIRRCPRNCRLWVRKVRHLERMEKNLDQIKDAFESALFSGFQTAEDYVAVWLCYLEVLRRKTDFSSEEEVDRMRKTFRLAWDSLGQMWGDTADTEFSILQFWARIEYHHVKDYEYGRELFEEMFSYPENRLRGGLWMEYINMEKISGGVSRARTCYKRAVKNSADPRLQRAWLCMERDHGTLDSLIECEIICAEKAKEWEKQQQVIKENKMAANQKNFNKNNRRQTNDNNEAGSSNNSNVNNSKQNSNKKNKGKKQMNDTSRNNSQQKSSKKYVEKEINKKQLTNDGVDSRRDVAKRKMDVLQEGSPAKMIRNVMDVNMEENTNSTGAKRKTEECESPSKRLKSCTTDVVMGPPPGYPHGKITAADDSVKADHSQDEDEEKNGRTVFISNLDYLVEEVELKGKLNQYGRVEELRLAKGPYGRICYCVYADVTSRDVALSRDRSPVRGRPMYISRYNPTKETRKKHFVYPTSIERNKLFVKNIAFDHCTKEKLTQVFDKYGDLKDIRIVTYKTGNPKGLAYIEYSDEKSAAAALQATDGLDVGGRPLSVALSAPPPKKQEPQLGTIVPAPPSTSRGHARTMLFVPSAVSQKMLPKVVAPNAPSSLKNANNIIPEKPAVESNGSSCVDAKSSKLSNSDFRNMLLNKK